MISERERLSMVRRQVHRKLPKSPFVRLGIGDDAALLTPGAGWEFAITTDLLSEGVHFLRAFDPARSCGYRLAMRAFSDLAAMGSRPVALFLSCAFPANLAEAWIKDFFSGTYRACGEAAATLAGGDLAESASTIVADVVGVGRVQPGRALLRSGARVGDYIFVSGVLGRAAMGRALVHSRRAPQTAEQRRAIRRHSYPKARWELGVHLQKLASAAIDISDGLSTDLDHLCVESGVGAEIAVDRLPTSGDHGAIRRALAGGEDYELLFTVPAGRVPAARKLRVEGRAVSDIGRITGKRGMWLVEAGGRRQRLLPEGWEHFRAARPPLFGAAPPAERDWRPGI